ncbi:MAG: M20/M25/M40 family metallo-hydrolase [Acidobacteria bacterium]|nr:M20/M25/M40 family metallo-hydrolase [Acidobacteriota bacterium]
MVLLLLLMSALACFAQDAILQKPEVRKALDYLKAHHEEHLDNQIRIAEIPAPTFQEAQRARYMEKEFRRVGLKDVEIDKQGNVLGWRPGKSAKALVIAAHLDISFAPGVNTKVRKEGKRWFAPGIGDDSRGLAALLAIVEALNHASIETSKTLLFVANVGEEGLGDLNGVRYLFGQSPHKSKLDSFISIDGVSPARIVNGGTGVKRYLVNLHGPGGHSYGNFGRPSAVHAAALIVAKLAVLPVPAKPKTTYNVGKISGGTTINAIAEEASLEVDLRSEDPGELDKLELKFLESVRMGVAEENAMRKASGTVIKEEHKIVSHRPGGQTPADNALVRAAQWASQATGHKPSLGYSSTDSNLPISLGIPAVTLGGGGKGNNAHSLDEWFEPDEAWKGPQMVLLTILAYGSRIP